MNTADILDRAAGVVEKRGWTQRWYVNASGEVCPRGAIYVACGVEPDPYPEVEVVDWPGWSPAAASAAMDACDLLDKAVDDYAESWNDRPERTKEEVVSTLRAAAQAARAEQ